MTLIKRLLVYFIWKTARLCNINRVVRDALLSVCVYVSRICLSLSALLSYYIDTQ